MQLAHRPTFRTNQKPHGPEFESPNPALSTCMALGKSSHPRVSVFTPGKWESGETHCSASPSRLSGGMRSFLGIAWKLQFFQPEAATLFLEEVVVFALQAFFFPPPGKWAGYQRVTNALQISPSSCPCKMLAEREGDAWDSDSFIS